MIKSLSSESSTQGGKFLKSARYTQKKIDVINVITAPEIEMLIIFAEDKYREFKKSGKKPSDYCKENLKMPTVKSYSFLQRYFASPTILVDAIKMYHEISKIPKGEYTLLDLLNNRGVGESYREKEA